MKDREKEWLRDGVFFSDLLNPLKYLKQRAAFVIGVTVI